MFFEFRQYRIQPGKRDEWVRFMEETIIPFQVAKGMVIVASFTDPEDPDHYIWMRRFDSEEQRVQQYDAVYKDESWIANVKPVIDRLMIRELMKVTRLEPTPRSVIR